MAFARTLLETRDTPLVLGELDPEAWSPETVDDGLKSGWDLALALGPDDRPYLSYIDVLREEVRLAYHDGLQWQVEVLLEGGSSGFGTDLLVDGAGQVHVVCAYGDGLEPHLCYLHGTPGTWCRLEMQDPEVQPGELLRLDRACGNPAPSTRPVEEYVLLEAVGEFWFWPSWGREPDRRAWLMGARRTYREPLILLEWPPGAGAAEGLRFWAALLDPTSGAVLDQDSVEWSFRE